MELLDLFNYSEILDIKYRKEDSSKDRSGSSKNSNRYQIQT